MTRALLKCVVFVVGVSYAIAQSACQLEPELRDEILGYQPLVDKIVEAVINGPQSGKLYDDLADYVDNFGFRQAGSENLERAIDNVIERQTASNLTVSTHEVMVPHWVRGDESAEIVEPRRQKLTILGLGGSLNTSAEGITAQVIVVQDFDELEARKKEVPGKIVLFNTKYVSYGTTGQYRNRGPNAASLFGAAAALVRSITPFSIASPHTGQTQFDNETLRIPAAAVSVEDAGLIARLSAKGFNVTVNLKMSAENLPWVKSKNVMGDITGASKPLEYVTISGHIDSWDVGQGAMDDAGGAFLAWHSLALINALGVPPPARTLRAIMWTAEEPGIIGANKYREEREDEAKNWTVAFESDGGVFQALGVTFAGNDKANCMLETVLSLFDALNATILNKQSSAGSDIGVFQDLGVPLGSPYLAPNNYFWFHHSNGDMIDVLKSEDLDQNLAIFASTTYILANLSESLPKTPKTELSSGPYSSATIFIEQHSFVFLITFPFLSNLIF